MTEELSYNFTDILTPGTQDTFNVVSISESENSSTPKNLVVDLREFYDKIFWSSVDLIESLLNHIRYSIPKFKK